MVVGSLVLESSAEFEEGDDVGVVLLALVRVAGVVGFLGEVWGSEFEVETVGFGFEDGVCGAEGRVVVLVVVFLSVLLGRLGCEASYSRFVMPNLSLQAMTASLAVFWRAMRSSVRMVS